MANVATALNEKIARISRKECRLLIDPLKAKIIALGKTVSDIKKERDALRRQLATVSKGTVRSAQPRLQDDQGDAPPKSADEKKFRFSAAGLRQLRERLELSRRELATLVGCGENAVWKWEAKKAVPRDVFAQKIAIVRGLNKRTARQLLDQHAAPAE
ncbi:helix-turn-helix domain-containing protein [Lysobacter sp. CA199]|uniref:helix-turn-helix domain-containing protein n=1 Tax=Lysobacter sp. CA199 TaxID=3455608 RepID=UPI003F8D0C08